MTEKEIKQGFETFGVYNNDQDFDTKPFKKLSFLQIFPMELLVTSPNTNTNNELCFCSSTEKPTS